MPTFDPSASRPSRAEAALLRDVLGPGTRRVTSLRAASRHYRRRQQRAIARRALIVVLLAGSFFGSVVLMSGSGPSPSAVATRVAPLDLDPVTTGSITRPSARPRPSAHKGAPGDR
jgi:hypothetical protein